MLLVGAGNRDPRVFDEPGTFDLTAPGKPHLGSGHGIHFCIGASLARLEGSVAIATVVSRYRDAALPDGWSPRWNRSLLRGLEELPVRIGTSW